MKTTHGGTHEPGIRQAGAPDAAGGGIDPSTQAVIDGLVSNVNAIVQGLSVTNQLIASTVATLNQDIVDRFAALRSADADAGADQVGLHLGTTAREGLPPNLGGAVDVIMNRIINLPTEIAALAAAAAPFNVFSYDLPDADMTLDYTTGPNYFVRAPLAIGTYTADHTVTLSAFNRESRFDLTILTEEANGVNRILTVINGGPAGGVLVAFTTTTAQKVVFIFDGTNWFLDRRSILKH